MYRKSYYRECVIRAKQHTHPLPATSRLIFRRRVSWLMSILPHEDRSDFMRALVGFYGIEEPPFHETLDGAIAAAT